MPVGLARLLLHEGKSNLAAILTSYLALSTLSPPPTAVRNGGLAP